MTTVLLFFTAGLLELCMTRHTMVARIMGEI